MRVKALTDTELPTGETVPAGMVLDLEPDVARALVDAGDAERTREDLTVDVGALLDAYFDRHGRPGPASNGPHG
jgi:hypothetical protein